MADVFVSYSRVDREIAQRVADLLEDSRISVWWDTSLIPGDQFRDVIESELNACYAAIVLWSDAARASDWVKDEAERAKRQQKLIQITTDGTEPPMGFGASTNHIADFSAWSRGPAEQCFKDILTAIRRFLPDRDDVDALREELRHLREVVAGLQGKVTALEEPPRTAATLDTRALADEMVPYIVDNLPSLSLLSDEASSPADGDQTDVSSAPRLQFHDVRRLAGQWIAKYEVDDTGPEPDVFRHFFIIAKTKGSALQFVGNIVVGDEWQTEEERPNWHVLYGYAANGVDIVQGPCSSLTYLGPDWEPWFEDLSDEVRSRSPGTIPDGFVPIGFSDA